MKAKVRKCIDAYVGNCDIHHINQLNIITPEKED